MFLQLSFHAADKVIHHNLNGEALRLKLDEIIQTGYKQWEVDCGAGSFKLLVGKKGNFKRIDTPKSAEGINFAHNRAKNHILRDTEPLDMFIKLGLMSKDGKVYSAKQKKFRQINKFLEIVDSIAEHVGNNAHILDFGCGKSYLTFALYHYFNFVLDKNVTITGLDLKKDVVEYCNTLAADCNYENLSFHCGDVKDFSAYKKCDMMISLHACNTATDFAIAHGILSGAKVILSVPCCQHELFGQIDNQQLAPILKHGILKERFASIMTDALRGQLLEVMGYRVSIMEFTGAEDTAKNIMIRAVKVRDAVDEGKLEDYYRLAREFSVEPVLYRLLEDCL